MQDCISKTGRWFSESTPKKGTQGRKIYAALSLISKSLWKAFSGNPNKRLHCQLLFPPLFPRVFYTFLSSNEYRDPGRHIRHSHGSNKSGKQRNCLSTQRALFPLRQTMAQKLLNINPLSSFWVSSSITLGSCTITVSPSRTLQILKPGMPQNSLFLILW